MNKWFLSLFIFLSLHVYAECKDKPVVIAVVDTGFGYGGLGKEAKLCKYGHKDFTSEQKFISFSSSADPVPLDTNKHGTNIVGIIEKYVKAAHINYCIVIIKFWESNTPGVSNLEATVKSFEHASKINAAYINYSAGGDSSFKDEEIAVKKFLDNGGVLVAAAGNNGRDIDYYGQHYYPASYDERIISVGGTYADGTKLPASNYGKTVKRWELGLSVTGYGITMSGTSQATAIATGKIVSQNKNKCDIGYK